MVIEREKKMAQNKTAMEHYVPQVYLRSFADEKNICHVYDKQKDKFFKTNISNIMGERYFYDFSKKLVSELNNLNNAEIDVQLLEKVLSQTVDGYLKNIIKNIEANYRWFSVKYPWIYLNIYKCITIQLLRTPHGRETTTELYSEIFKEKQQEEFTNLFLAKEIFEVLKEYPDSYMLNHLLNNFGHICLGINDTTTPFITGDQPVIELNGFEENGNSIIYYPVTPRRCIILMKRAVVSPQLPIVIQEVKEGKFTINGLSDITMESYAREKAIREKMNPLTKDIGEKNVNKLNAAIGISSERFVVSKEGLNGMDKIVKYGKNP